MVQKFKNLMYEIRSVQDKHNKKKLNKILRKKVTQIQNWGKKLKSDEI